MSADGSRYAVPVRGRAIEGSTREEVDIRLWDAAAQKKLSTLRPYPGESPRTMLGPLRLSRDGRRVAFIGYFSGAGGREDRRLKVLDCDTGRTLLALSDVTVAAWPAFDDAGVLLAVWDEPPGKPADGKLIVRDLAAGKELRSIPLPDAGAGKGVPLDFSPDGTRLAALTHPPGSRDRETAGEVRVWETASGKEVLRFKTGPGALLGVLAYSPDGKRLAVVGEKEPSLKLRDAATGELLLELTGQVGMFRRITFSPDGARLAGISDDGKVRIWDVSVGGPKGSRAPVRVLHGLGARVQEVAFSADGREISASGVDGTVMTWEVAARAPRGVVVRQPDGQLSATAAAAAAARFAAAWDFSEKKTEIQVWDAAGKLLFAATDVPPSQYGCMGQYLRLSADGTRLAFSAEYRRLGAEKRVFTGRLRVWDVASGQELFHREGEQGRMVVYGFSPDGRRLATSRLTDSEAVTAITSRVSVWDLSADTEVLGLDVPGYAMLALSPDGRRLAACLLSAVLEPFEAELRVWDVATGEVTLRRSGFRGWFTPVFDGDGKRLAVAVAEMGNGAGVIHLLDAGSGAELCAPLKGHKSYVGPLAFSPDGRRLASADGSWGVPDSEGPWDATPLPEEPAPR